MPNRGQGLNDRFKMSYNDIVGVLGTALSGSAVWTVEQINDTGFLIPWLRHDQDDYFQMNIQLPHDRKPGTNLASIHIHAVPGGSVNGDVYLSYAYTWVKDGDAIPAIASWTTGNATISVAGADTWKHKYYSVVTNIAPPANETPSSFLLIKITRLGTDNVHDTYTSNKGSGTGAANFGILGLDVHSQMDRIGTDTETSHS